MNTDENVIVCRLPPFKSINKKTVELHSTAFESGQSSISLKDYLAKRGVRFGRIMITKSKVGKRRVFVVPSPEPGIFNPLSEMSLQQFESIFMINLHN